MSIREELPVRDQRKAVACGLAAVALWATVGSAFKLTLRHATPVQLLFYAALMSAFLLVMILACRGEVGRLFAAPAGSWQRAALLGLVNPFPRASSVKLAPSSARSRHAGQTTIAIVQKLPCVHTSNGLNWTVESEVIS